MISQPNLRPQKGCEERQDVPLGSAVAKTYKHKGLNLCQEITQN